jgi:hypothetical protein
MNMSEEALSSSEVANARSLKLRTWERLCAGLVFAGAVFTVGVVVVLAAMEPHSFWAGVSSGAIPWYSLILPALLLAGAVLLLRMSRWSFAFLATHLVLAFAYSVSRHGAAALSALSMLGFGMEGLAVVFTSYLGRTGKLR